MQLRAPRSRPLALAAVALVAGLVAGLHGLASSLLAGALIALSLALTALLRHSRGLTVVAALTITGLGGLALGAASRSSAQIDCRFTWQSSERVRLHALALGYLPVGEEGIIRVRPLKLRGGDRSRRCSWSGSLRVLAQGPLLPGARLDLTGTWQPSKRPGRGARSPERTGWVVAEAAPASGGPALTAHPFLWLRSTLAQRVWQLYPRRWAPLALALVLGQRETVAPEVSRRMGRAGLAHLLAISGFHVGLLAAALFTLGRVARLSAAAAHIGTAVLTALYVVLIGAPASAVRAGLMITLWSLSRLAGRGSSPFDVLGLAAILLLLARPWSVTEPGFQLSFAGAAAVGWASRETGQWAWLRERPRPGRALAVSLFTSAAAVLLTAPISAAYFGRVAPGAILGNLLAVPLLALAMPALFLSATFAPWPAVGAWFAHAATPLLWAIDRLARLLSETSWASFELGPPTLLTGLLYVGFLILVTQVRHGPWYRRRLVLFVGVVWAGMIAAPVLRLPFGSDRLQIYVIDVGQGDAIAIRTPRRRWLLVDAGPNIQGFDAGRSRVVPLLREWGVGRLEAWLASHPDLDHVGGGPAVMEAVDVDRVVGVGLVTGQLGQLEVLRELAERRVAWLSARAGSSFAVDGVSLAFLHPPAAGVEMRELEANALSLVFRLDYGDFRMLFTGDLPGELEDRLAVEAPRELRAQVLKVSHHGSASSSTPGFLAAVRPQLAVVSVGRGNIYKHPSPLVIARLGAMGTEVHRTDREGTLVISASPQGGWSLRSAAQAGW